MSYSPAGGPRHSVQSTPVHDVQQDAQQAGTRDMDQDGKMVRVAIAGCGAISRAHLQAIADASASGVEVAGVFDQDGGRAAARAQEFGARRTYGTWQEVLDDQTADVVALLLPHDLHCRYAVEALAAGHHVVVEKPMATTLAECDQMISAARQAGRRLHPVHNRLYDRGAEAAKSFIASGAIGDVFLAQTVGLEPPATVSVRPWLGTKAGGGGVLLAQAVHPAYVLRWILGDVAEVACFQSERNILQMAAEDTAIALLRFRTGAIAELTGTFALTAGPHEHGISLYGPHGYVEIHSQRGVSAISEQHFGDTEAHSLVGGGAHSPNGFRRLWEDYARGIATGAETRVTAEDGKRVVEMVLAAYQAVRERRTVTLPLPQ